jgi:hypothetical protein
MAAKTLYRKLATMVLLLAAIGLPLAFLEGVLRAFPGLISTPVLMEYPKTLKREIASRLGLPVKQARRCLSSAERYDNGPELCLAQPNFHWVQKFDPVDAEYGALEDLPQDKNGFCNLPEKAGRAENPLIVIGDSFTWCWNVPPAATAAARLENKLQIETYNLGFPGVGPFEYVEILKRFGLKYAPRIVVMNIYEGNDLRDGMRYWKDKERHGDADSDAQNGKDGEPRSILKRFVSSSYSLSFVLASIELLAKEMVTDDVNFRYQIGLDTGTIPMNVTNADQDEVRNARQLHLGEASPSVWHDALADFVTLAEKNDFIPIVAYIPSAHTAYAGFTAFEDPTVGRDVALLSSTQRGYLARLGKRLGFRFVDLTPFMQEAARSGPLAFFPGSLHLTEAGHEIVATELVEVISEALRQSENDNVPEQLNRQG